MDSSKPLDTTQRCASRTARVTFGQTIALALAKEVVIAMNLIPFFVLWMLAGLTVLGLALYRKILTFHGDDELVHLDAGEEKLIPQQIALGHKLDVIDRWGKTLTVFTVVLGLLIGGVFLYQGWLTSVQLH
jgi:hypothetical protein